MAIFEMNDKKISFNDASLVYQQSITNTKDISIAQCITANTIRGGQSVDLGYIDISSGYSTTTDFILNDNHIILKKSAYDEMNDKIKKLEKENKELYEKLEGINIMKECL